MITNISIKNYKSIVDISLPLSRINVFIGENGAGKSNILEAIVLAGAASADRLDNEFLASRGVRVTAAECMRPAFSGCDNTSSISISVANDNHEEISLSLSNDNKPYSKWVSSRNWKSSKNLDLNYLDSLIEKIKNNSEFQKTTKEDTFNTIQQILNQNIPCREIQNFLIYSPENSTLRSVQTEEQIEPLGIKGEGLLKFLSVISEDRDQSCMDEIKSALKLLGWFADFRLSEGALPPGKRMEVTDSYLDGAQRYLDQMSTNEGFLFLLFYFAAVTSPFTPKFFGIDNVDASLNPKLCEGLIKKLAVLTKKHDKQLILTTHNPATLDGLNLDDDEQRLFVVSRGRKGETRVNRINKPAHATGTPPVRLSEMFIKGILGGLPKGF